MTTSTETTEAPTRRAKPAVAETAPTAPVVLLSLDDYLSREKRLFARPEMTGAFARHCQRAKLMRASAETYAAKLTAFERGVY